MLTDSSYFLEEEEIIVSIQGLSLVNKAEHKNGVYWYKKGMLNICL